MGQSSGGFSVSRFLQLLATDRGSDRRGGAALAAIATNLQTTDHDVKPAVALNLSFQAVEQVAFKLGDLAATKAGHVNMIALRTALVKVLLALQVHEVQFVH